MGKQQDHAEVLKYLRDNTSRNSEEITALTDAISALKDTVRLNFLEDADSASEIGVYGITIGRHDLRERIDAALQATIHGEAEDEVPPAKKLCKVCQKKPCHEDFDHCCGPDCIPF